MHSVREDILLQTIKSLESQVNVLAQERDQANEELRLTRTRNRNLAEQIQKLRAELAQNGDTSVLAKDRDMWKNAHEKRIQERAVLTRENEKLKKDLYLAREGLRFVIGELKASCDEVSLLKELAVKIGVSPGTVPVRLARATKNEDGSITCEWESWLGAWNPYGTSKHY